MSPVGFANTGDFVVEYTLDGDTYTTIATPSLATNRWSQVTINNPFNGVVSRTTALRFRRLGSSVRIAIDDVVLSGVTTPNFAVSPPDLTFPGTAVNSISTLQSISVAGSGLTSDIAVKAPTGFRIRKQGDAAYLADGATLTLTRTNGNIDTKVEVVFNPTTPTPTKPTGQISFVGGGAASRFVSVTGTVVTPNITVNPATLTYGNVEVNTQSSSQFISIVGSDLTDNISVQVPTGYIFRKSGDATFLASGTTLTLVQASGSVNADVEIRLAPTTIGNFNGNVSFVSNGATTRFVGATGAGVAPAPVVTVSTTNPPTANSNTIGFPDTRIGRTATPASFYVSGQNLDNNTVTVSSPSNEFLIRLGRSGAFGSSVILNGTNGTLAATELQVQFAPSTVGPRNATIAASSGTTVNSILQVSGNGLAATNEIFITPDPATLDFQTVSSNGSSQILTFQVGATLIGTNPLVLTPASSTSSNANIEIREANVGDFQTGPLTFQPVNGSVTERTIEVRLTGPLALGNYEGSITASSNGTPSKAVRVIATSNGTSATVSADNTLQPFSTVPGVASAAQSFPVNGQGLIRDITVKAPALFQIALNEADFAALNGATGNTITVVRNNDAGDGFKNPVPVYVRYLPSIASQQPDSGPIAVTSEPAIGATIQVQGYSAPSVEIQSSIPEIANVEINTLSNPVAVTVHAVRVRQAITVSEVLTQPTQFNNPLQDQFEISLKPDAGFGSVVTFSPNASTYSIDQVVYVRYKPTHIGNATSKLQFRSSDFINSGFQDFPANGSLLGKALDTQPTAQTTINVVRNGSTATVTFSPAQGGTINGAGEGRLIIASLSNQLAGNNQPTDGQSYLAADGTFGQGTVLANGYFSVYTGTGDQAIVKGLDPSKAYYFYVFDYNYVATNSAGQRLSVPGAENYRTPTPPNQLVPVDAIIPPDAALPVELVSFTAKLRNHRVDLNWVTAMEKNNKGFEVQRSQDGKTFSTILFKEGHGNSSNKITYTAVDQEPLFGTSYYRLNQIDADGKSTLSSVVSVTNGGSGEVSLYPNPAHDVVNIRLAGSTEGVTVRISDLTGRAVRRQVLSADGQLNISDLQAGTYIVTIGEGAQKVTRKIVKE
ncbi:T9SS type A sorting domain-containing protein [Hymenobacter sp. BT491]|uniref:T9SS type A sorting domain-containing protein n=1 Tax=Hymenobacter sp. BT491 TaxID=2766779 RepID=UPI001653695E|nr:T9SS type A sorting domain-containing protein [Hymenobacter sp. BT491]MBC6989354.1 T9SS type A sorting domain-containing protein [Hymenobacter sp. BT491]